MAFCYTKVANMAFGFSYPIFGHEFVFRRRHLTMHAMTTVLLRSNSVVTQGHILCLKVACVLGSRTFRLNSVTSSSWLDVGMVYRRVYLCFGFVSIRI